MEKKAKSILPGITLWVAGAAILAGFCVFLLCFTGNGSSGQFPVRLNEILAANTLYPDADGRCLDYIELYNSADYPVDLTGFQLGDIAGKERYAFPAGTVMQPGEYLLVFCDTGTNDPSLAHFGISRSGGEDFYLIAANRAIADHVTTLATDSDQAMVRLSSSEWGLSDFPTPGRSNDSAPAGSEIYNASVTPVRISEYSAGKTGYLPKLDLHCDWIELHNTGNSPADLSGFTLSDNVGSDKYTFPAGTTIPADGYWVVYCSGGRSDGSLAPFNLSRSGGEYLVLKDGAGNIAEVVMTSAMRSSQSVILTPDGSRVPTDLFSPGFENTDAGHAAFLRSVGALPGTVVITELMASPEAYNPDAFGNFSDWAELRNTGDLPVDLTGWFLSDNPKDPQKWSFPAAQLQPGEHLLVRCSGKDTAADGEIHTSFSLSAGGEDLILTSCYGQMIDSISFGKSETNCSFIFDSGEAALCAYPTPGYENTQESFELLCSEAFPTGELAIWEVMTANDTYLPQQLGECYDWVELRNVSDRNVALSDYAITDDPDDPAQYILPDEILTPGKSIVIILSGDTSLSSYDYSHAPFSLNAGEDQLLLYRTDGTLTDFVYLRDIPLGQSYGRQEDIGGFFYMTPTPGRENRTGTRLISEEPTSPFEPGVYTGDAGFDVSLHAAGTIYYTTDSSEPDTGSMLYNGPIHLERTTVLRAIAAEDGKLPSSVYTATFVVNEPHSIPVVSLVTDPGNLWGEDGVYRNGDITVKEVKFGANVAYACADGSFSLDCEMSLHGDTTVTAFDKKSFTLRFSDRYDGRLNYDVFGDGEVTLFSSLLIRTAHESSYSTQMHDALIGAVASDACPTLLAQKYKYVALYLDGQYWGLYAIREHHSPEHYASYMHVPASDVTMVCYGNEAFNSLYDLFSFCGSHDLSMPENYDYAKSVLDMTSLADWMIMEAYTGNFDINGNMRYYYSPVDGLWRCGLVDLDLGMAGSDCSFSYVMQTFHHSRLTYHMMKNAEFQDLIARRLAELLSGPMSDAAMLARIDAMANEIRPETPLEEARWGTPVSAWETFVSQMRDLCDGHAAEMIADLCWTLDFTDAQKEYYFGEILREDVP